MIEAGVFLLRMQRTSHHHQYKTEFQKAHGEVLKSKIENQSFFLEKL